MPVDLRRVIVGETYDRDDLLRQWQLASGGERDKRCFVAEEDTGPIALFVTEENRGTQHSRRQYANGWRGEDLWMEVNDLNDQHNERLRRSPGHEEIAILYREKTGQPFTYRGRVEYVGEHELERGELMFVFRRV